MTGHPPSPPDRPVAGRRPVLLVVLVVILIAATAVLLPRVAGEMAPTVVTATADTTVTAVPTSAAVRPGHAGPVAPPAPPPPADRPGTRVPGWRLVWSDEFDGTAVDRSKWNVRDGEPRDVDLGCNVDDPANVLVGGGVLTLRAQRRSTVCAGQPRQYTEGYLDTIGKASFRYGRFEIRAESPNGPTDSQGLWPAFWLRPDDGGKGEIDVVELPGGTAHHRAATQAVFYDYRPVKQDQRWEFPSGYPADGFHTYTTEWEPGVLRWYVDGRLVWQRDRRTTPWFDEAFDKPFNLRLNFQVGGWLGAPDAATAFPADFRVDHVRVWQR
ncbi:glycoside hydrolase family 16 protein [Micromonospora yasonensis]|uniref:glycoside hydrolase family 16 protein n=1 Tax=Micromonospora yasonensis TaxID=1128667 RepID=UPI00222FCF38|nr:glycoside hydrolase family 16 protein [Micromonospora yasonensis]MCW3843025.1 glycoside hydrolase family 16 protein [Micromonospora yasonensis]